MPPFSYSGYRFPRDIIQSAVWMYLRFMLSFRDVEELLAERGITVSHESIRRWVLTFGPAIARRLRARRPRPHGRWHLDEMFVRIGGNGQAAPSKKRRELQTQLALVSRIPSCPPARSDGGQALVAGQVKAGGRRKAGRGRDGKDGR